MLFAYHKPLRELGVIRFISEPQLNAISWPGASRLAAILVWREGYEAFDAIEKTVAMQGSPWPQLVLSQRCCYNQAILVNEVKLSLTPMSKCHVFFTWRYLGHMVFILFTQLEHVFPEQVSLVRNTDIPQCYLYFLHWGNQIKIDSDSYIDCNPYIYIIVSQYNPMKIGLTLSLSEIRLSISICSTCSECILQCSIFQAGCMVVHGSMGYLRLVSHDLKRWWRWVTNSFNWCFFGSWIYCF